MTRAKAATRPRPNPRTQPIDVPAITERLNVHDEVAAELGIDPARLLAEITDAVRAPFVFGAAT